MAAVAHAGIVYVRLMMKRRGWFISFSCHMTRRSNDAFGIERPKTGMFTFDESSGENTPVVSEHAKSYKQTCTRVTTDPRPDEGMW